jgi:hypothetical protein
MQLGLMDKWNEDAQYEMELNHAEDLDEDDFDTYHRSMMLADLGMNFIILALGLIMSCLSDRDVYSPTLRM